MSIFKDILGFFVGLFNAAKKAYAKLSPEQQLALQEGTGLVAIINENLDKAPAEIRALIQQKFPGIDEPKLEAALFAIIEHYRLFRASNLDEAIQFVQSFLKSREDKEWAIASHSIAAIVTALFAPKETKASIIVSLLEFVYQTFIKKA